MRGSEFHQTEYFGPILGIMSAKTLAEAISIVNEIEYGLTSGLQSLDRDELRLWLSTVEAGNLYVNRGITGAIVRRQPFGGWKKSAIGMGSKAGGPNYLFGLVDWEDDPISSIDDQLTVLPKTQEWLSKLGDLGFSSEESTWLRNAMNSDALAWKNEFGVSRDVSELGVERNILRYRPTEVVLRFSADASVVDSVRGIAAAIASQASFLVSTARHFPSQMTRAIESTGAKVVIEDPSQWEARLRNLASLSGGKSSQRVRLISGPAREREISRAHNATFGKPDIAIFGGKVVSSGRIEMLPYFHEQAVSITAHRFGSPIDTSRGLL
jgi:RHH-type proline utilization regulon transcriptional repressor/proline dehydrogenase/delta 1-pyrroline-5-carboxylate dehydrogenase